MKVMRTLMTKAALAFIALALAASAASCVADRKAQTDHRKPTKTGTAYYHEQLENSDNDIETYDRWRYLFGS
jgi:hypothetical protein